MLNLNGKSEAIFEHGTCSPCIWEKGQRKSTCRSFSSNTNLSGLRKVHIRIAAPHSNDGLHNGAIERIFLEFEKPLHPNEPRVPLYGVYGGRIQAKKATTIERTLEIDRNDGIVAINVWKTSSCVQAIRFFLKSGKKSEIYGVPLLGANTFRIQADHPDSKLARIYGTFGDVVENIGFLFARTVNDPPPSMHRDNGLESPSVARRNDEDQDVIMGWAFVISIFMTGALVSWMGRRN